MRSVRLLVIAFALLVSAEPVYHTHPLSSGAYDGGAAGSTICACAASAQQITTSAPVIVAPQMVVGDLAPTIANSASHEPTLSVPARAPPAV